MHCCAAVAEAVAEGQVPMLAAAGLRMVPEELHAPYLLEEALPLASCSAGVEPEGPQPPQHDAAHAPGVLLQGHSSDACRLAEALGSGGSLSAPHMQRLEAQHAPSSSPELPGPAHGAAAAAVHGPAAPAQLPEERGPEQQPLHAAEALAADGGASGVTPCPPPPPSPPPEQVGCRTAENSEGSALIKRHQPRHVYNRWPATIADGLCPS